MGKYRYVGTHPVEVVKGDKVIPLGPGEFIDLSAEEMKANKEIEDQLLDTKEKS